MSENYSEEIEETESEKGKEEETLEARFRRERMEWRDSVSSMGKKLQKIEDLISLEIEVYSKRQIALEYSHTLMHTLSKINAKVRTLKKNKFLHYTNNYDLKLDKDMKNLFIATDLEKFVLRQELLNNHLTYIKGTIDSIDKIIFGLKWRIDIEKYRRENIK